MAGSPVIQPKAGAVKAPELSPYYTSIYISGSLSACSLGFALSTRSPHYIYVTRWRLSVHLLGFAIFTVSHPLFTRSKQDCIGLLSLSLPPHSWWRRRPDPVAPGRGGGAAFTLSPSAREAIHYRLRYSLSPSACAGGTPTPSSLLPYVVWADPASRHTPCHIPTTLRYKFLWNRRCSSCMWIFFDL